MACGVEGQMSLLLGILKFEMSSKDPRQLEVGIWSLEEKSELEVEMKAK